MKKMVLIFFLFYPNKAAVRVLLAAALFIVLCRIRHHRNVH
jgi:hypothetical protein